MADAYKQAMMQEYSKRRASLAPAFAAAEEASDRREQLASKDPLVKLSAMAGSPAFRAQAMSYAKQYPERAAEFRELASLGHVPSGIGRMSVETEEGLQQSMEREIDQEQLMSVEPEQTETSEAPQVADSPFAKEAGDAATAGAGLTSGVDSVIYRLRQTEKAIKESTGKQKEALEAHAETLKAQAGEVAAREQEMADRADRRVRGMELMKQRHDEATARAEAEIRNAERMVTSHEIDPNRAFKTTGARVGSAIAIAMSALGQGMSGRAGPNTAYKIINDAINRDIDLQKEELRTRKDVLRNKNNLYANMMAKFGNERSAELATAKAGITAATQSLQALKATHKSENAHLAIDEQIAKLEADGQKKTAELLQVEGSLAVAKMNAQARAGVRGRPGKQASTAGKLAMAKAQVKELAAAFEDVDWSEGLTGSFLRTVFGESAVSAFASRDATIYENLRTITAKFITNATDGGRPTDKDFAVLLALIPPGITNKNKGREMIGQLEGILERASSAGGMTKGFLEQYGNTLGYDAKKELQYRYQDVEKLKEQLGFTEGQ